MTTAGYTLYELVWIFLIYGFLGWCVEVAYAATVHGKFVNRGFCFGPICPIYGVGVLPILVFLEPIKEHWLLLFLESMIITSFIEFAGGFVLEKFFHEKWWDYSGEPFNLKGYICLRFSIMWGIACVLVVNVIHPTVMAVIRFFPSLLGMVFLCVCCAVFLADFSVTVFTMLKLRKNIYAVIELEENLTKLSESIGSSVSSKTLEIMQHGEKLKNIMNEKADEFDDKRDELFEKLAEMEKQKESLRLNLLYLEKRSRRIGSAFPNIVNGKYKQIFKK